jgi:hypothetical protein
MNTLKTLLIVLVLNFGFSMSATAAFQNGNSYRQSTELLKIRYVMGIVDSIQTLSEWKELASPDTLNLNTCTKSLTAGHIVAIVDKYLESNPEQWHLTMGGHVINALLQACEK